MHLRDEQTPPVPSSTTHTECVLRSSVGGRWSFITPTVSSVACALSSWCLLPFWLCGGVYTTTQQKKSSENHTLRGPRWWCHIFLSFRLCCRHILLVYVLCRSWMSKEQLLSPSPFSRPFWQNSPHLASRITVVRQSSVIISEERKKFVTRTNRGKSSGGTEFLSSHVCASQLQMANDGSDDENWSRKKNWRRRWRMTYVAVQF